MGVRVTGSSGDGPLRPAGNVDFGVDAKGIDIDVTGVNNDVTGVNNDAQKVASQKAQRPPQTIMWLV